MLRTMVGCPKVEMLEHWGRGGFEIVGHREMVDEPALARIGPWASQVMGAPTPPQPGCSYSAAGPPGLGVAGTAGFMAMVSEHEPGQPCAGCLHSWTENVPGDVPTVFLSLTGPDCLQQRGSCGDGSSGACCPPNK